MTTQEIIKSLRICADKSCGCESCAFVGRRKERDLLCPDNLLMTAADELERLSRENEEMAEDIAKFAGREAYGE